MLKFAGTDMSVEMKVVMTTTVPLVMGAISVNLNKDMPVRVHHQYVLLYVEMESKKVMNFVMDNAIVERIVSQFHLFSLVESTL